MEPKLSEIADGVAAYLQPDGSWGLSNAGLVVGEHESLLVDTFFDLAHTRRMLDAFGRYVRSNAPEVAVNTHANGDHCYGNVLAGSRRVIASKRAVHEMREMPPRKLAALMRAARGVERLGRLGPQLSRLCRALGLSMGSDFLDAAPYVLGAFSRFDFERIEFVLPNETFETELEIDLGSKRVRLLELGPAHTGGDIVAYLPETKTLFSGDLLFEGMHPLIWAGTLSSYASALERLLSLEIDVVVPGHGKLTDKAGIVRHLEYLTALRSAAAPLFRDGMNAEQAALRLMRQDFGALAGSERLVVNVAAAFREFRGQDTPDGVIPLFGAMSRLASQR